MRIIYWGNAKYLVESEKKPGYFYEVDYKRKKCKCDSYKFSKYPKLCKHLIRIYARLRDNGLGIENLHKVVINSRRIKEINEEDKRNTFWKSLAIF